MSVIVLGMEMPKDCDSCWVPGQVCNLWLKTDVGKRNRECPLRPLPEKHGRLIDADAFIGTIRPIVEEDDYSGCTFRTVKELMTEHIDEAPTIVEAEGD